MGITVVYSTRTDNPEFTETIKKTCGVHKMEVISYVNEGDKSLTEIYNDAIDKSKNDIIVFCHDDIIFNKKNWGKKILKHFNKNPEYGVIGLAGSDTIINGTWWDIKGSMWGIVSHTDGSSVWKNKYSEHLNENIQQVVLVDGVLFAINRKQIINRFNEDIKGFHFYDVTFCLDNFLSGVKIGVVTNIDITHKSIGEVNEEWHSNKEVVEKMYTFPISCRDKTKDFPDISLFSLCWNEKHILPHFFRHYDDIVSSYTFFDNESTDISPRIIKQNKKANIKQYSTNNQIRDDFYLRIKNSCWKFNTGADIVIVCDTDEFIYHPRLKDILLEFYKSDSTLIKLSGYDMITEDFDFNTKDKLIDVVKTGFKNDDFNKILIFKPNFIKSITYNFGCHNANPKGLVKYFDNDIKLLHYKRLGLDYFINKMSIYKKRLSAFNKKNKFGFEYDFDEQKHRDNFKSELDRADIVI